MTSPPTPQPKQWKNPLSRLTWNDGVFSPWNGHSPFYVAPAPPQRHVLLDDLHDVGVRLQVVDERWRERAARYSFSSTTVTPPPPWSGGAG